MLAHRTPWKMTEIAFLREHYRAKGAAWCATQLGRTRPAVSQAARDAGLQRPAEDLRHVATPAMLEVIRRAYQSGRLGAAGECARSLGKPLRWVSKQANAMGLTTRIETYRAWSETEAAFVEERSHMTTTRIALLMRKRGWKRSPAAIYDFIRRKGLKGASDQFMPAVTAALCLGVHVTTTTKWIKSGLLIAERRGWNRTEIQHGDGYLIEDAELARFIVQNAGLIDMRKVDGPWLIDLLARLGSRGLTDARDKGQRIVALKMADPDRSNTEIAAMVDSTPGSVGVILARHRASAQREAA